MGLVCNFRAPGWAIVVPDSSRGIHDELETMLHEFGVLHGVLSNTR